MKISVTIQWHGDGNPFILAHDVIIYGKKYEINKGICPFNRFEFYAYFGIWSIRANALRIASSTLIMIMMTMIQCNPCYSYWISHASLQFSVVFLSIGEKTYFIIRSIKIKLNPNQIEFNNIYLHVIIDWKFNIVLISFAPPISAALNFQNIWRRKKKKITCHKRYDDSDKEKCWCARRLRFIGLIEFETQSYHHFFASNNEIKSIYGQ